MYPRRLITPTALLLAIAVAAVGCGPPPFTARTVPEAESAAPAGDGRDKIEAALRAIRTLVPPADGTPAPAPAQPVPPQVTVGGEFDGYQAFCIQFLDRTKQEYVKWRQELLAALTAFDAALKDPLKLPNLDPLRQKLTELAANEKGFSQRQRDALAAARALLTRYEAELKEVKALIDAALIRAEPVRKALAEVDKVVEGLRGTKQTKADVKKHLDAAFGPGGPITKLLEKAAALDKDRKTHLDGLEPALTKARKTSVEFAAALEHLAKLLKDPELARIVKDAVKDSESFWEKAIKITVIALNPIALLLVLLGVIKLGGGNGPSSSNNPPAKPAKPSETQVPGGPSALPPGSDRIEVKFPPAGDHSFDVYRDANGVWLRILVRKDPKNAVTLPFGPAGENADFKVVADALAGKQLEVKAIDVLNPYPVSALVLAGGEEYVVRWASAGSKPAAYKTPPKGEERRDGARPLPITPLHSTGENTVRLMEKDGKRFYNVSGRDLSIDLPFDPVALDVSVPGKELRVSVKEIRFGPNDRFPVTLTVVRSKDDGTQEEVGLRWEKKGATGVKTAGK